MDSDQGIMGFLGGEVAGEGGNPPTMDLPTGNPIAQAMDAVIGGSDGMGGGSPAAPGAYADPFQGMPTTDTTFGAVGIPEMTKLREWETKHEEDLENIARKEETAKREARQAAADDLTKWSQDKQAEISKRLEVNRAHEQEFEAGRLAAMKPGANPWELVHDLIDTSSRTADESRDTSRMRSLLIQLKSDPVMAAA